MRVRWGRLDGRGGLELGGVGGRLVLSEEAMLQVAFWAVSLAVMCTLGSRGGKLETRRPSGDRCEVT